MHLKPGSVHNIFGNKGPLADLFAMNVPALGTAHSLCPLSLPMVPQAQLQQQGNKPVLGWDSAPRVLKHWGGRGLTRAAQQVTGS